MFSYLESISINDLPQLPIQELRQNIIASIRQGCRVLAFFGLPPQDDAQNGISLCCILARQTEQGERLTAFQSKPVTSYESLTPLCPQLHLFERELWEEWNILPEGHPWLKPVRFCQRPDGSRPGPAHTNFFTVEGSEVHEVAVGPVHAGIIEPGHFRFQCHGENVMHLEIVHGFQHRGILKMLRSLPFSSWNNALPLLECVAGDTSIAHATAFCTALERLLNVAPTPRSQRIRRIALELERLANHTGDLGAIAGDTGFLPTSSWNGRIRGDFLNLTAAICGNRFGRNLLRFGGIAEFADKNLTPERCEELDKKLAAIHRDLHGSVAIMMHSASVNNRLKNTGTVSHQAALDAGLVGVAARACGLDRDARQECPLSNPIAMTTAASHLRLRKAPKGDVYGRTIVRSQEAEDSCAQVSDDLRSLEAQIAPVPEFPKSLPPDRLAVAQVEGWRGEVCHVILTGKDGGVRDYRIIDPSFHNWLGLSLALRDEQISDFPLCNKSFNLSYCGHDL